MEDNVIMWPWRWLWRARYCMSGGGVMMRCMICFSSPTCRCVLCLVSYPCHSTMFGTKYACPPEIWQKLSYTRAVDSWGLGIIMYMLLMGQVSAAHKHLYWSMPLMCVAWAEAPAYHAMVLLILVTAAVPMM